MRSWGYEPNAEDLAPLRAAQGAFRALWASIRPPWPAAFDGDVADAEAIDYLHYEGIGFPECGEEGAALVCGEVLRAAAGLRWVIDYRGDWYVASAEDDWPAVAFCPLVRLKELEYAGTPQFGRHARFLARAAADCLQFADPDREPRLREVAAAGSD